MQCTKQLHNKYITKKIYLHTLKSLTLPDPHICLEINLQLTAPKMHQNVIMFFFSMNHTPAVQFSRSPKAPHTADDNAS